MNKVFINAVELEIHFVYKNPQNEEILTVNGLTFHFFRYILYLIYLAMSKKIDGKGNYLLWRT